MNHKLSDFASLAEIIGAFAVVISLIYVGIQVNDSNSAIRSAAVNDANVSVQSWYLEIGSTDYAYQFYDSLMSDEVESPQIEFRFIMSFHGVFLGFQNSYLMVEEGTLDPELVDGLTNAVVAVKDTAGFKRYWRQRRGMLHPRFVSYVEGLLERDVETPMDVYRRQDG
jgi:hypothetical protein